MGAENEGMVESSEYASYQSQQNNVAQVNNQQPPNNTDPNNMLQQQQQQPSSTQTLRLRDDPPPITPAPRNSRKRKTPPSVNNDQKSQPQQQQHQTPPIATVQHSLPPTHTMVHPPPPHMQPHSLPQGYQYDYSTGGIPVPPPNQAPNEGQMVDHDQSPSPPNTAAGRALSSSKRAEQNRKAQRAFRERRDQHVKALESRSQLLDAALASADEANRRWEECRALVDQLRLENTALRANLLQVQQSGGGGVPSNNNA